MQTGVPNDLVITNLLNRLGWQILDITEATSDTTFDDLERANPVTGLRISRRYLLVPIPAKGQTLAQTVRNCTRIPIFALNEPLPQGCTPVKLYVTRDAALVERFICKRDGITEFFGWGEHADEVHIQTATLADTMLRRFYLVGVGALQNALKRGHLFDSVGLPLV